MHKIRINGETLIAKDGERLSDALLKNGKYVEHPCGGKGTCGKCLVTVNGKQEISCQYKVESDICVALPESGKIFSPVGADETGRMTDNVCFVLDIGTTTLALALVSLDEKRIIKVANRTNPQRAFGADIMSRIEYCRNNSAGELQAVLTDAINAMFRELDCRKAQKLYVAGNTTMLHLFFGVDCSSMGVSPYTPVFLESKRAKASDLGIEFVQEVEALPSISAFVGADIVAGLNFVELPSKGKFNLLVDLGTNAEIVLFSGTSSLCTSAAAGPCFEGVNISCGMSAVGGAICAYNSNGAVTIDGAPAKGICSTGLVDIIATLIKNEIIDKSGFMKCESFNVADGVYINQSDIRQYQLAKSAVYSGIVSLLNIKGITFDDIETLYISGGFSGAINVSNATDTGLLPVGLKERCVAVNNSCLRGAIKYACERNDLSLYIRNAHYVDLSANPIFKNLFIQNMTFDV